MITRQTLIYSVAAFKRICAIAFSKNSTITVQEWAWVVWVHAPGFCRFISKAVFKKHFVDRRKELAKEIQLASTSDGDGFLATSSNGKDSYLVTPTQTGITCTCEDYQNQIKYLGKGCCKHGYAALNLIGYESLADWIAACNPA